MRDSIEARSFLLHDVESRFDQFVMTKVREVLIGREIKSVETH